MLVVGLALLACVIAAFRIDGNTHAQALALITTIAGAMLKMFSDAFAFEFGSSRGSKEKDGTINQLKQDMLRMGAQSREETRSVLRAQEERLKDTRELVLKKAGLDDEAAEVPDQPRDLVSELVKAAV